MSTMKKTVHRKRLSITPAKGIPTPRTPRISHYNLEREASPEPRKLDLEEKGLEEENHEKLENEEKLNEKNQSPPKKDVQENQIILSPKITSPKDSYIKRNNRVNFSESPQKPVFPSFSQGDPIDKIKFLGRFLMWLGLCLVYSVLSLVIYVDIHLLSSHSKRRSTVVSTLAITLLIFGLAGLLSGDVQSRVERIPIYFGDNSHLSEGLKSLEGIVEREKTRIDKIFNDLKELNSKSQSKAMEELRNDLENVKSSIPTLSRRIDEFKPQNDQLKMLDTISQELATVMNNVDAIDKKTGNIMVDTHNLRTRLEKLENMVDSMASTVQNKVDKSQMDSLIYDLKQLIAKTYVTNEKMDQLRNNLAHLSSKEDFKALMDQVGTPISNETIKSWIAEYFDKNMQSAEEIVNNQRDTIHRWIEQTIREAQERKENQQQWFGKSSDLTRSEIIELIESALERHNADGIGLPDFALQSTGARIDIDRTSSSYYKLVDSSFLGYLQSFIQKRKYGSHPSVVLQPDNSLGNCWAFPGSHGNLTVRLPYTIYQDKFSLDHVSDKVAFNISSAPKDFKVWGIDDLTGTAHLFGQYQYQIPGKQVQTFSVQNKATKPYSLVTLEVISNYDHKDYTCIYRFRVHGQFPSKSPYSTIN